MNPPVELLEAHYSLACWSARQIVDGDEALVWKVTTDAGAFIAHVGPRWRRPDELAWIHEVVAFAAREIAEAVVPVATTDGKTFVETDDGLLTVFPHVEGKTLRSRKREELRAAGRLLARIHRALLGFSGGERPPSSPDAPRVHAGDDEPPEFTDPELDAWWEQSRDRWTSGVVHGDYYNRNVLCRRGRIVGVIDWHEARCAPLIAELAFAAHEFATDDDMTLIPKRARIFIDTYKESGPIPSSAYGSIVPFMRLGLRNNARYGMDVARRGGHADPEYVAQQARAFVALRNVTGMWEHLFE